MSPEPAGTRMCDNSFRESTNEDLRQADAAIGSRLKGTCNLCDQQIGAVVIRRGVVRINWHERRPVSACPVQADNGLPDEDF